MRKSSRPKTQTDWTPEQKLALARVYPLGGANAVMELYPEKTKIAVWAKAREMNVRKLDQPAPVEPEEVDDWPIERCHLPVGAWRAELVAPRSVFDLGAV